MGFLVGELLLTESLEIQIKTGGKYFWSENIGRRLIYKGGHTERVCSLSSIGLDLRNRGEEESEVQEEDIRDCVNDLVVSS